jgi:tRNA threonylcarbamoyladenosine modification (KEOPS) complex  Pcc1 subunit
MGMCSAVNATEVIEAGTIVCADVYTMLDQMSRPEAEHEQCGAVVDDEVVEVLQSSQYVSVVNLFSEDDQIVVWVRTKDIINVRTYSSI